MRLRCACRLVCAREGNSHRDVGPAFPGSSKYVNNMMILTSKPQGSLFAPARQAILPAEKLTRTANDCARVQRKNGEVTLFETLRRTRRTGGAGPTPRRSQFMARQTQIAFKTTENCSYTPLFAAVSGLAYRPVPARAPRRAGSIVRVDSIWLRHWMSQSESKPVVCRALNMRRVIHSDSKACSGSAARNRVVEHRRPTATRSPDPGQTISSPLRRGDQRRMEMSPVCF